MKIPLKKPPSFRIWLNHFPEMMWQSRIFRAQKTPTARKKEAPPRGGSLQLHKTDAREGGL